MRHTKKLWSGAKLGWKKGIGLCVDDRHSSNFVSVPAQLVEHNYLQRKLTDIAHMFRQHGRYRTAKSIDWLAY